MQGELITPLTRANLGSKLKAFIAKRKLEKDIPAGRRIVTATFTPEELSKIKKENDNGIRRI